MAKLLNCLIAVLIFSFSSVMAAEKEVIGGQILGEFLLGDAGLNDQMKSNLLHILNVRGDVKVIVGTDNVGTEEVNRKLGQARLTAVKQEVERLGFRVADSEVRHFNPNELANNRLAVIEIWGIPVKDDKTEIEAVRAEIGQKLAMIEEMQNAAGVATSQMVAETESLIADVKSEKARLYQEAGMKKYRAWIAAAVVISIASFSILALVVLIRTRMESVLPEENDGSSRRQDEIRAKEIEIALASGSYLVRCEYRDGSWYSPFKVASGEQVKQPSLRDLKKSLRGCLTKPAFEEQKNSLKDAGLIRVKQCEAPIAG